MLFHHIHVAMTEDDYYDFEDEYEERVRERRNPGQKKPLFSLLDKLQRELTLDDEKEKKDVSEVSATTPQRKKSSIVLPTGSWSTMKQRIIRRSRNSVQESNPKAEEVSPAVNENKAKRIRKIS